MILRTYNKEKVQSNQYLGNFYQVVDKERSPEAFKEAADVTFGKSLPHFEDDLYSLIQIAGTYPIPLYKGFEYTILNERGEVFDDLTFK